jgi:hypothetical protein
LLLARNSGGTSRLDALGEFGPVLSRLREKNVVLRDNNSGN